VLAVRDNSDAEMIYNAAKLVKILSRGGIDNSFQNNSTYRNITSEDYIGLISRF
jgi:hypothetical protein